MNRQNFQFDGLGAIVVALGVILFVMFVPTIVFAIKGDKTGFYVSIAVLVMLFIGIMVMGAAYLSAQYTRSTMREGAMLSNQAQDFNDRWDAQKMATASKLFMAGASAARQMQPPQDYQALPLPSQGMGWMPQLEVLEHRDDDLLGPGMT